MDYQHIRYTAEGPILTITLNRPDKLNAFTPRMQHELLDACDRADADDAIRDIVRTGEPLESLVHVPDHDFWLEFCDASEQTSAFTAAIVAGALPIPTDQPVEVLDVACGSGVHLWPSFFDRGRLSRSSRGQAR